MFFGGKLPIKVCALVEESLQMLLSEEVPCVLDPINDSSQPKSYIAQPREEVRFTLAKTDWILREVYRSENAISH